MVRGFGLLQEDVIAMTALQRAAALAIILATSTATDALAQTTAADPDTPEMGAPETAPSEETGSTADQAQDQQPDQPGMMSEPVDQGTMGSGMMCSEMCSGMMEQGATEQGAMCSDMCAGMMGQGDMDDRATDSGAMDQGRAAPGMRDQGRMGPRARNDMRQPGLMGAEMHGHMMKIVFALADADGNGGLSLDELATLQTRIFAAVDADEDGNVTPEEVQAFIQE